MNPTLVMMAAGVGSRYGGMKQLDTVGPYGEALLEYSVYDAIRAGFGKVVFVIRQDIDTLFRDTIGKRIEGRIAVEYMYQELDQIPAPFAVPTNRQKPWGTGHAILVAAEAVEEPFAAINADNFYGAHSFQLLGDYLRRMKDLDSFDYAMVGFVLRETLSEFGSVNRAVCQVDANGSLQSIRELANIESHGDRAKYCDADGQVYYLSGDEMVSRNMWGFSRSIFGQLKDEFADFLREQGSDPESEFLIPTVVGTLIARREARVKVLRGRDRGFGVTYTKDKPSVLRNIQDLIAQGVYPGRLWV
ncbi:MAG: sugar phosphate nucleotidyltransferase [Candidatus Methylomirabilales bacterium]